MMKKLRIFSMMFVISKKNNITTSLPYKQFRLKWLNGLILDNYKVILYINNYMNKRNTSEIKIRKKTSFRPIMLTSKSIKPMERSQLEKNKHDDKAGTDRILVKRRESQNYSNSITKAQMIKKLTQQYRQQLIKNVYEQSMKNRSKGKAKPITPSIIHVQFDNERQQGKQSRYQGEINQNEVQSESLQKYFYCTNARVYDQYVLFNKNKINTSLKFNNLPRSYSSKPTEDWNKFLDKYYLNVKKIKPESKNKEFQSKISEQKLNQITVKVQQYQNNLMKKMQQKYKISSSQATSYDFRQQSSELKSPKKSSYTDFIKIQQDMTMKRQSNKKQHFVFGLSQMSKITAEQIGKQKFQAYKDFLWKVNFSNGLYVRIRDEIDIPYKFFVGPGNNSMLIKGIMRRRFWWQVVQKPNQQTNFVWTQIKINQFFKLQNSHFHSYSNRNNLFLRTRKVHSALQHIRNNTQSLNVSSGKMEEDNDKKQAGYDDQINQFDSNLKIFTGKNYQIWQSHLKLSKKNQQKQEISFTKRIKNMVRRKNLVFIEESKKLKIQNHFQSNYFLGNKKALFYSMRKYYTLLNKDPFQSIPLTFHISKGIEDPEYENFLSKYEYFQERKKNKQIQNIWIVKPGEMTNRGRGISVCSTLDDIKIRLKSKQRAKNGEFHTYIVQKYIQKPLLYYKRKFDIRHYMMMTCVNGKFKGYWFEQGYIRTTSYEYNIKNCKDLYTHLTNDAIQKFSADYGKYEKGNKVSYADFQKYLNANFRNKIQKSGNQNDKYDFYGEVLPRMKSLAADAMRATYMFLSPKRSEHNFQLFGLDFMLDEEMNTYLIEVNTNPCLQTSCPLLSRLISSVIQNLFKICVDPLFPPPYEWPNQRKMQMGDNALEQNRFCLIFDETEEEEELKILFQQGAEEEKNIGLIDEEDQVYDDEGKQWVED